MLEYDWNEEKNRKLKKERGIGFEDIIQALADQKVLGNEKHPNRKKYPNQKLYIVEINGYAYVVPYVETKDKIFFKTIFPSRVKTRKYLD